MESECTVNWMQILINVLCSTGIIVHRIETQTALDSIAISISQIILFVCLFLCLFVCLFVFVAVFVVVVIVVGVIVKQVFM